MSVRFMADNICSFKSPRWLVMCDRYEDARESLRQLREGKYSEEEILVELDMMVEGICNEPVQSSFAEVFRGANLRRTWIVVGANIMMQATGQQFTSIYGALYAKSLGTVNPFNVTIAIAVVNVATALLAMALLDRVGRRYVQRSVMSIGLLVLCSFVSDRVMILTGACIQVAALMTMGGLGTAHNPGFSIKAGIIAMMVIFNHGYSLGWAPCMHILSAEIPSTRCRDMTYRCASVLNVATQYVEVALYLSEAP